MNFKMISFNVQRLNRVDFVRILWNYIDRILQLDMFCIQEHKLWLAKAANLRRYLWPRSKRWICDASPGYNNLDHDQNVGFGGIANFLAKRWSKLDSTYGTVMGNRGQLLVLKGLLGGDVGFVNIYAPNDIVMLTHLWGELIMILPPGCR